MILHPVQSSHVAAVGYDEGYQVLEVEFKDGAKYQYSHVTHELWMGLWATIQYHQSVGHWLHANIRAHPRRHPYLRVQEPREKDLDE